MRIERISLSSTDEEIYLDAYIAHPTKNFVRKALLVIPGGGYSGVCFDREGEPIAMAFIPYGYNAFVLNYSVGRKRPFPAQLIEVARAIKHIKDHAEEYGIDPEELFTVGFSAGGHLSASAGVLWKLDEVQKAVDMPYGYNKPKGTMLIYPVFSYHRGSFKNLWCTDTPSEEQIRACAIHHHVDRDSAPAFIVHTANDDIVDVSNAIDAAQAYSKAGVPFELHIYPDGPHGLAVANDITASGKERNIKPDVAEWVRMAAYWADHL